MHLVRFNSTRIHIHIHGLPTNKFIVTPYWKWFFLLFRFVFFFQLHSRFTAFSYFIYSFNSIQSQKFTWNRHKFHFHVSEVIAICVALCCVALSFIGSFVPSPDRFNVNTIYTFKSHVMYDCNNNGCTNILDCVDKIIVYGVTNYTGLRWSTI